MDSSENPVSDLAEAFVALIQKQMKKLADELADGQTVEAIVPLANGGRINASWFGYHNPDMVKITGVDADGNDVCLLAHKNTVQVMLRKTPVGQEVKPQIAFQLSPQPVSSEMPFDQIA